MNIFKNDKVTLVKEFENLKKVGETYEVANITDTLIVVRERVSKMAIAAIPIDEFKNYFTKQVSTDWTDWEGFADAAGSLIGYYRTNHKKVQVKSIKGDFKGVASCNTKYNDSFSLDKGIRLAYARCRKKAFQCLANEISDTISKATSDLDGVMKEIRELDNFITSFGKE